jgi:hypothetical protein
MKVGGKKRVVTKARAFIAALSSPVVAAIVELTLLSTWANRLYSYSVWSMLELVFKLN